MADETQPEVQPAAPAADPVVTTEPVAPDPTQAAAPDGGAIPTTSPDVTAPTSGDPAPKVATPVVVNQYTSRDDNDVLLGHWCDVVSGDYAGRRGQYRDDAEHDPETGYPSKVIVRTRDAENELIVVNYSDIRPTTYTGGR